MSRGISSVWRLCEGMPTRVPLQFARNVRMKPFALVWVCALRKPSFARCPTLPTLLPIEFIEGLVVEIVVDLLLSLGAWCGCLQAVFEGFVVHVIALSISDSIIVELLALSARGKTKNPPLPTSTTLIFL